MAEAAILTFTGVLAQGVGLVWRVGLTRLAGAEVLGLYQLLLPLYAVAVSFTAGGLTTGISTLSARYAALGNPRAIWQVRGQGIRLFLARSALPCLLGLLFSDGASVYLLGDARTRLGLLLLLPCLVLTGIENLHKHYFYGVGKVLPAALAELAEQVLRAGLSLGFLLLLAPDTAEGMVGAVVLGMAFSEGAAALLQLVLFRLSLGPVRALEGPAGREAPSDKS